MMEINTEQFILAFNALSVLETIITVFEEREDSQVHHDRLVPEHVDRAIKNLRIVAECCPAFGAKLTLKAAGRLIDDFTNEPPTYLEARAGLTDVRQRMLDEFSEGKLFALDEGKGFLFRNASDLFGKSVVDKFPDAEFDIEEAGKCLAMSRNTAAVFHLMRAMEIAVQTLSRTLGIQNAQREWGKLLSDIGAAIQEMPAGLKRDSWSESHSRLYHVKQAWRNPTMHPEKMYTDEVAGEIFDAVKAFMRQLSGLI